VPARLAGIGGGVLVTLQQSGLALGVATLGTLYLGLGSDGSAFVTVVGVQTALALVLALGSRTLPTLDAAPAAIPVEA
jgi:hypothetical protein